MPWGLWAVSSEPGTMTFARLPGYIVDPISISNPPSITYSGKPFGASPRMGMVITPSGECCYGADVQVLDTRHGTLPTVTELSLPPSSPKVVPGISKGDIKGDGTWTLKGPVTSYNVGADTIIPIASDNTFGAKINVASMRSQQREFLYWRQLPGDVEN